VRLGADSNAVLAATPGIWRAPNGQVVDVVPTIGFQTHLFLRGGWYALGSRDRPEMLEGDCLASWVTQEVPMRSLVSWWIAAGLLVSCGTEPEVGRLANGNYEAAYQPPLLTSHTPACDRLLSRVFLVVSRRGTFELSINVIDACTGGGQGCTYFEIFRSGGYFLDATEVSFTPNAGTPTFTGRLDGEFINVRLPAALGLAPSDVEVRVGPRESF
jgi:hypothetical protein